MTAEEIIEFLRARRDEYVEAQKGGTPQDPLLYTQAGMNWCVAHVLSSLIEEIKSSM